MPTDAGNERLHHALGDFFQDWGYNPEAAAGTLERLEANHGNETYRLLLHMLTRLDFEAEEARDHWFAVRDHLRELKRALNRDVGFPVALADYFTTVHPLLNRPVLIESSTLEQKEKAALVDELTGLYNRRFFNQILLKEIAHAQRSELPFSLFVIDVDRFKDFNNQYGHKAGDDLLTRMAQRLMLNSRAIDYVARYGGDEFTMVLPQVGRREAFMTAERHRRDVERFFSVNEPYRTDGITISIGVATFPSDAGDGLELFQRADEALFKCKKTWNRVMGWEPEKRRFPRFAVAWDVEYGSTGEEPSLFEKGLARDVSLGGLLCQVDQPVELGRSLDVVLIPEDGQPISLRADVVRLTHSGEDGRGYYLGLAFELETTEKERAFQRVISDLRVSIQ